MPLPRNGRSRWRIVYTATYPDGSMQTWSEVVRATDHVHADRIAQGVVQKYRSLVSVLNLFYNVAPYEQKF